jgi:hypothetical protein
MKRENYRQGIINSESYCEFRKGQIVNIIVETKNEYLVQTNLNSKPTFIKKNDLIIN